MIEKKGGSANVGVNDVNICVTKNISKRQIVTKEIISQKLTITASLMQEALSVTQCPIERG